MAAPSYAPVSNQYFSSFSLKRVYLAGGAGRLTASNAASVQTWTRLPGSVDLTLTPGAKSVDQYGDDGLVNIWIYDARAAVEIMTSMSAPDIYAILTKNTVTGNGASGGATNITTVYFGSDLEYAPPHFYLRAYSQAVNQKAAQAASEFMRYTLFNCQMTNLVMPESAQYGRVGDQRYRVEVLPGYVDEYCNALTGVAGPGSTFALGKLEGGLPAYPTDNSGTTDSTFGTIFG